MPKISTISSQKRKGRYNVYVDAKFAFGIDEDTLVREELTVGKELSEWQIEHLVDQSEIGKLYQKTLNFLKFRPRSEKEVRDYLKRKILNSQFSILNSESGEDSIRDVIETIVARLKDRGYIDDKAFSCWWVEQRSLHKPRGRFALLQELRQKGVVKEIAERAIKLSSYQDEVELAMKAAQGKMKTYRNLEALELRRKMGMYLTRRGFSWEIIKEVIDALVKKR